jgi:hypothetical protein
MPGHANAKVGGRGRRSFVVCGFWLNKRREAERKGGGGWEGRGKKRKKERVDAEHASGADASFFFLHWRNAEIDKKPQCRHHITLSSRNNNSKTCCLARLRRALVLPFATRRSSNNSKCAYA